MKFTEQSLTELVIAYEKETGQKLSRDEVSEMAFRLVTLFGILGRKLPEAPRDGAVH